MRRESSDMSKASSDADLSPMMVGAGGLQQESTENAHVAFAIIPREATKGINLAMFLDGWGMESIVAVW